MDRSRSPRPSRSQVSEGSLAMSPQIEMGTPRPRRVVDHLLEEAEDGGLQRLAQMRDVDVLAIGRERVLDEVVRADAEERRTSRASRSTVTAALGVSSMIPSGRPRVVRDALGRQVGADARADRQRAAQLVGPVTSGSMMRIGPDADAR